MWPADFMGVSFLFALSLLSLVTVQGLITKSIGIQQRTFFSVRTILPSTQKSSHTPLKSEIRPQIGKRYGNLNDAKASEFQCLAVSPVDHKT